MLPSGFNAAVLVAGSAAPPAPFGGFAASGTAGTTVGFMARLSDPPPAAACVAGDTVLCPGQPRTLTATATAAVATYRWNTGATGAVLVVTQPGTYAVTVTFADGQTRTVQHRVTAFGPVVRVGGDSVLCAGATVTLQGMAPNAASYQWSTGASTPALTVGQPGTYTFTARYANGCAVSRRVVVRAAVLTVAGTTHLCPGGRGTLAALAPGAAAYRWDAGDTTAVFAVTQPGTYSVTATFPGGCTLRASHAVAAPTAAIRGDSVVCAGRPGQLTAAQPGAVSYQWSTGATTSAIAVAQPGVYSVELTYPGGCTRRAQVRVQAGVDNPPFTLGADTTLCGGSSFVLRAPLPSPAGAAFRWADGPTGPARRITQPGEYVVERRTACGSQTARRRVSAAECVVLPTVVTPNGDGANDRFRPAGLPPGPWALAVFNRWGRPVYQTGDYRQDWGADAAPGVYFYVLRHGSTAHKGVLEIIR